jgi:hypothetical protein
MSWGTIADWVAAVGTSGALLWAIVSEGRRQRSERDAPAHRLSGWVEWRRVAEPDLAPRPWTVYVRNSGEMPIYGVIADVGTVDETWMTIDFGVVAAGSTDDYVLTDKVRFPPSADVPAIDLFFRTSDGRLWHREARGELRTIAALPDHISTTVDAG